MLSFVVDEAEDEAVEVTGSFRSAFPTPVASPDGKRSQSRVCVRLSECYVFCVESESEIYHHHLSFQRGTDAARYSRQARETDTFPQFRCLFELKNYTPTVPIDFARVSTGEAPFRLDERQIAK